MSTADLRFGTTPHTTLYSEKSNAKLYIDTLQGGSFIFGENPDEDHQDYPVLTFAPISAIYSVPTYGNPGSNISCKVLNSQHSKLTIPNTKFEGRLTIDDNPTKSIKVSGHLNGTFHNLKFQGTDTLCYNYEHIAVNPWKKILNEIVFSKYNSIGITAKFD